MGAKFDAYQELEIQRGIDGSLDVSVYTKDV